MEYKEITKISVCLSKKHNIAIGTYLCDHKIVGSSIISNADRYSRKEIGEKLLDLKKNWQYILNDCPVGTFGG